MQRQISLTIAEEKTYLEVSRTNGGAHKFYEQLDCVVLLFPHDFIASGLTLFLNHYLREQEYANNFDLRSNLWFFIRGSQCSHTLT